MLDYFMMQHRPGSIYKESTYRCPNCGTGPLRTGDLFLMNRCFNCGRYQHETDFGGCDLVWVRKQGAKAWQRLKACFASALGKKSESFGDLSHSTNSMGGKNEH